MAPINEETKKEYEETLAAYNPTGDVVVDAQEKAKREGNYKDYYSQVMQNYMAREYANKYYQNQLQAQGISTQGAGQTAMLSLSNQMYNANAEALRRYRERELEISQESQAEREQDVASFVTNLREYGTAENYQDMLREHGFMDEQGNFTEKFASLDDRSRGTLLASLKEFEGGVQGLQINQENISDLLSVGNKLNSEIGKAKEALGKGYIKFKDGSVEQLREGMVIKLSGSSGKAVRYVRYNSSSNTYTEVGAEEYNSQKGRRITCRNGEWEASELPEGYVESKKTTGVSDEEQKSLTTSYRYSTGGDEPRENTYFAGYVYRNGKWIKLD